MRYIFLLFIIVSCSEHKVAPDSVLFVKGWGENPDSPRMAIKLTPDSLYYCVENVYSGYSGNYDYYGRKFDRDSFYAFKRKADKLFANVGFTQNDVADAAVYSIVVKENGKYFRKEFIYEYLDDSQLNFVMQLEKLFDKKCKPLVANPGIDDGLLKDILPEEPLPPPFPSGNDTE